MSSSMQQSYRSPEYISAVRSILKVIGNNRLTTTQIESALPDLNNIPSLLQSGLKYGWTCRTQILPDIWQVDKDMISKNYGNIKVASAAGEGVVKIPPSMVTWVINSNNEPFTNQPRSFIPFHNCPCH